MTPDEKRTITEVAEHLRQGPATMAALLAEELRAGEMSSDMISDLARIVAEVTSNAERLAELIAAQPGYFRDTLTPADRARMDTEHP